MLDILHREAVYLWYYFSLQLSQIFRYWVLGMVLGSAISVFAKEHIHSLFRSLHGKRLGVLGIFIASALGIASPGNDGVIREEWSHTYEGYPVVYVARDVSAEALLAAYEALEASFDGPVAVKLSKTYTNEGFAWTELIGELSASLDEPVIVETPASVDFSDYDCTIVLSHFRSHDTIGFNGAVKQTAIISIDSETASRLSAGQGDLERLARKGKETVDSLDGHILYINVMDRITIESAGMVLPESNTYDIGILASYDPVALDQACIDLVAVLRQGVPFLSEFCNGMYTLAYGEQIGLGSRTYALTILDN